MYSMPNWSSPVSTAFASLKGSELWSSAVTAEIGVETGSMIPPSHPFVGDDANRTRAGIHGHGLAMDERIYQIFDTASLLGRPPAITITDKSGLQGIVYWVQCYLAETVAERTEIAVKKTELVDIAKWVDYQYDELGRTTGISDDEMTGQALIHVPDAFVPAYVNKEYGLKGEARVSADDCAPIIGWLRDEKVRLREEAGGRRGTPISGVAQAAMQGLVAQHLPQVIA